MKMVEVKTAYMIGPELDWATGVAVGASPHIGSDGTIQDRPIVVITCGGACGTMPYDEKWAPSSQWSQGGLIIAEHGRRIGLELRISENSASHLQDGMRIGYAASTVLVAACRAIVSAKLGDVVSVPAELAGMPR